MENIKRQKAQLQARLDDAFKWRNEAEKARSDLIKRDDDMRRYVHRYRDNIQYPLMPVPLDDFFLNRRVLDLDKSLTRMDAEIAELYKEMRAIENWEAFHYFQMAMTNQRVRLPREALKIIGREMIKK